MVGLLRSFPLIPSEGKGVETKRLHHRAGKRNPLGRKSGTHIGPCFASSSLVTNEVALPCLFWTGPGGMGIVSLAQITGQ